MKTMGSTQEVENAVEGRCATCGKTIHPNAEFKDPLSAKEFTISGMCQACQDSVFGAPE